MNVQVKETDLFGETLYRVYVEGVMYDKFFLMNGEKMSDKDKIDVAWGYAEALTGYGEYSD